MSTLSRITCAVALPAIVFCGTVRVRGDYALKDGDTVVFLGDSITAARTYGKIVENFTLLRFPDRKVRFVNAAWGGDTAAGGLKRLERDVFVHGPTVLIVAYGINDIGWGTRADAEHKQIYLDAIRGIVTQCKERKVRVFIASAAVTAEDPARTESGFLQAMCDEGMALSRSLGEGAIDVQRTMREIQKKVWAANASTKNEKDKQSLHAPDGVHLNDLGQLAMAFAILKGLEAPAEVSSVTVDAQGPTLLSSSRCQVTGLSGDRRGIELDRRDDGLPLNLGLFGALQYRFIPIPDELNRYMITAKNLSEGRYEVSADGRSLGTWTAGQLASGVNIASATANGWEPGGPWEAQAWILIEMTNARTEIASALQSAKYHLPRDPRVETLQAQMKAADTGIEALQRTMVKPAPYHFVIRPAPESKPKGTGSKP